MTALQNYEFPGNIRELENIVERAVILCDGGMIDTPHISVGHGPATGDPLPGGVRTLQQVEQDAIIVALQASSGKISGPGGAAEMLGLKPSTLESRMKKLGIDRTAGS